MATFDGSYPIIWVLAIEAIAFAVTFVYASFFEHVLHRYLMHRKNILFYPYQLHALVHHKIFRADESFHALNKESKKFITFSEGEYIILPLLHLAPLLVIDLYIHIPVVIGGMLAMIGYLVIFDLIHYSFHCPNTFFFERFRFIKFLKRHHLLHHKYQDRNLNVVLPIADLVFRTRVKEVITNQKILNISR